MPDGEIIIRKLELRDLPQVTAVHKAAFPDGALTFAGDPVISRYYEWQLTGPHDLTSLGAFTGTSLAGFCFGGKFRGALSGFVRKNIFFLFFYTFFRPWLMLQPGFLKKMRIGLWSLRFNKPKNKAVTGPTRQVSKSFGILSVAVDPSKRRLGIGKILMEKSEAIAKETGFVQMNLTVHPSNQTAVSFYERLGWKKLDEDPVWKGSMMKEIT